MAKYTYKDIIIDPQDERLKGAIGKEVYYNSYIKICINNANRNCKVGTLIGIDKTSSMPFKINADGCHIDKDFIVLKKEPKVKYVPFDLSKKEDRDALRGKWITKKRYETEVLIDFFTKHTNYDDEEWEACGFTGEELLEECTFLDGSPVGKKVEE